MKMPQSKQIALLESLDSGEGEGNQFFRMAKSLTVRIYYATEVGVKELNKRGTYRRASDARTTANTHEWRGTALVLGAISGLSRVPLLARQ